MKNKVVAGLTTIIIAFFILLVSIVESATPRLAYTPLVLSEKDEIGEEMSINYNLAYSGKINPDNPLWYAKAFRDKLWYLITFKPDKKAELNLLFSDKRLGSSLYLFNNNKPDLGVTTLIKGEKYLEKSMGDVNNPDLYKKIALASLKHREVIEKQILINTPQDLKPEVVKTLDYSKSTYLKMKEKMLSIGLNPPVNPFETE